jgi:transcriptional regulator with XRE-family HTH domain
MKGGITMTNQQAAALGDLIRAARNAKGLSYYALAALTGMDFSWLARLERGQYTKPDPAQLARLAEALDIDPARIDRISKNHLANSLPTMRTYLRSKEKLSPQAMDAIEQALADIRAQDAKRRGHRPTTGATR